MGGPGASRLSLRGHAMGAVAAVAAGDAPTPASGGPLASSFGMAGRVGSGLASMSMVIATAPPPPAAAPPGAMRERLCSQDDPWTVPLLPPQACRVDGRLSSHAGGWAVPVSGTTEGSRGTALLPLLQPCARVATASGTTEGSRGTALLPLLLPCVRVTTPPGAQGLQGTAEAGRGGGGGGNSRCAALLLRVAGMGEEDRSMTRPSDEAAGGGRAGAGGGR